jgi:hypothetical protein
VPAALGDAAALIGVAALAQQADQVWWEGSSTSA